MTACREPGRFRRRAQLTPNDSLTLLALARQGDVGALDRLIARYRPRLVFWAHGRLPRSARDLSDTDDLVQDTLIRTIDNLDTFVPETEGSFVAYLRRALWNRIRDELRRARTRPSRVPTEGSLLLDDNASPLETLISAEKVARYETALAALDPPLAEAIIARFELRHSFAELAGMLNKPSPDAAREYVERAVVALSRQLQHDRR